MAVGSKEELQHESITASLPTAKIDKQIKVSERFNTIHEEFFLFYLFLPKMCESGQWSHICSIITCIQLMETLWLIISYTLKVISQPCLCCTNLFNYLACCLLLAFKMLSMFGSVPVNCALTGHIITAVEPGKLLMGLYWVCSPELVADVCALWALLLILIT